jgi:hypothetical protein
MRLKRSISLKMSGEDVKFLQNKLKEFGLFKERVDGYFGQNTLVSVTNFQKQVGVKVDGLVGPQTWSHLISYNPNPDEIEIQNKKLEQILNSPPQTKREIPFDISYIGVDGLTIWDCPVSDDSYIKETTKKETIWIHNSFGCSRPDWTIGSWSDKMKKKQAGVGFVIGRGSSDDDIIWDGKVLRAFDDKYWSYHLDIGGDINSKSIGIEICNYGPLSFRNGKYFNSVNFEVKESDVCKFENPFMGHKYWEKYTDKQLDSLSKLIEYLQKRWNIRIDKNIYDESWFSGNYSGNLRSYNLFPQKDLIEMLNSL